MKVIFSINCLAHLLLLLALAFQATSSGEEAPACTRLPLGEDVVKWLAPQSLKKSYGIRKYGPYFLYASPAGVTLIDSEGKAKWTTTFPKESVMCWTVTGDCCILAVEGTNVPRFVGLSCADGSVLWNTPVDRLCCAYTVVKGGSALLGARQGWWCAVDADGNKIMELKDNRINIGQTSALAVWNDRISVGGAGFLSREDGRNKWFAILWSQMLDGKDRIAPEGERWGIDGYDWEHQEDGRGIAASKRVVAYSYGPRTMFCPAAQEGKGWTECFTFTTAVFLGDHLVCAGKVVRIYDTVAHKKLKEIGKDDDCRIWPVDDTKCVFVRQGKAVGYVCPESPLGKEFPFADKVFAATIVGNSLVCLTADSLVTFQLPEKK